MPITRATLTPIVLIRAALIRAGAVALAVFLIAPGVTLSTARAQVQTTLAEPDRLPRLVEWLAPDADAVRALTERPAEELSPPYARASAPFLFNLGRLAFRSPLIFGSYAARAGLSCDVCHTSGGANRDFFVDEVSDRPGNVDVTHGFWRRESEDGIANPVNIPTLRGVRWTAPYGRDGRFAALEDFTRNVIVHEFAGAEPAPVILDALVAYQRALAFPTNADVGPAGRLTWNASPAARRGEVLFLKDCAACHRPSSAFVDGRAHDVGTGGHFDTPSLLGLGASAPYFHDGRAPGLFAVIAHFEDALGLDYDASGREDLAAYLETIGKVSDPLRRTLTGAVDDLLGFASALDFPLNDEDFGLSDLIAAMLRTEVGRIAERFPPAIHADARETLKSWSRGLAGISRLVDAGNYPAAREALAAWREQVDTDKPTLVRLEPLSFYSPAALRRALDSFHE